MRDRLSADPLRRALATVMSVEGQITAAEARQLMKLAQVIPSDRVIVEIGSYRGRSAIALARGARLGAGCRVYAIDPHLEFRGVRGGRFGPQDQAALYANLNRAKVGCDVAVISLSSATVARAWPECNVGLLWIDGDHQYEGVRADVDAWLGHVAAGGVLAFHDDDAEGVQRTLDEITSSRLVTPAGNVDRMSWFTKGP